MEITGHNIQTAGISLGFKQHLIGKQFTTDYV